MKKLLTDASATLFLLVLIFSLFASCEKEDINGNDPGELEFALINEEFQDVLKTVTSDSSETEVVPDYARYHLLISVRDEDGVLVLDKEIIPLYKFSNQFISQKIKLDEGRYSLTEFMVLNSAGEVIFATPKRGSPLAHLVKNPLPVEFRIIPGDLTLLRVEVLPVHIHTPGDFGYASFGLQFVKPLKIYVAAYLDHPLIMAPSALVSAKLEIYGPDGWTYDFELEPKVNELIIRAAKGNYVFVVKKDTLVNRFHFSLERLRNTSPRNPLMLPVGSDPAIHEKIIKTSPEATADALIHNLKPDENFGDHKFFAASFKSEPVLTVMRTTRSLMHVDVRRHLPKSATIKRVELILYVVGEIYPMEDYPTNTDVATYYRGVLKQIVKPWEEGKVTWNNQPETINANQVFIDYNPWIDFNRRVYDVTRLFVPVDKINAPNYGFMLMHYPENMPGGIEFASSDFSAANLRPMFRVHYTLPPNKED